jgi:hypothetical protein
VGAGAAGSRARSGPTQGPVGRRERTADRRALWGTLQVPAAGAKPSPDAQLAPHIGVLITGCQAEETSADACPSGDPSKAFGALTNALTTTVKEFKAAYPDQNISYRWVPEHCLVGGYACLLAHLCFEATTSLPGVLGAALYASICYSAQGWKRNSIYCKSATCCMRFWVPFQWSQWRVMYAWLHE